MLRWNGLGRSLVFAAAVAAGLPVAVTFGAPWLGGAAVVKLYLLGVAGCYAAGLGERRTTRRAAWILAGAGVALGAALPLDLPGTALWAAALVALCRSGIHYRQRPLRAVAIELALGGTGLAAAAFLASGGLRALALAVWGYLLVQSTYFLIGGRAPRGASEAADPFERARARLERIWLDAAGPPLP